MLDGEKSEIIILIEIFSNCLFTFKNCVSRLKLSSVIIIRHLKFLKFCNAEFNVLLFNDDCIELKNCT